MGNPLISVIVPVYNVEKYLDKCVQSIVNQTYTNLEIILIDDGSPDNCPKMCDEWAEKDSRIKVIHKENGGASSARNAAIDIARGDYFAFVDSDDFIHPQMYEKLFSTLKNSSKKIAHCLSFQVVDGLVKTYKDISFTEELEFIQALNKIFQGEISIGLCDRLFVKDIFQTIRFPEGETNEEAPIIIPMLLLSEGIVHVNERLYYYNERSGGVTGSFWKTNAEIVLKNLRIIKSQLNDLKLDKLSSFKLYVGKCSFSTALHLDKNYFRINAVAKKNLSKYIHLMRKYWFRILFSEHVNKKDKLLYFMIITRTLRPIYKIIRKQ